MKLHEFIQGVGHQKLAKLMNCTEVTIKNWRDYDFSPSPLDALKLIKLSHDALTWGSIYEPYCEAQLKKRGIKLDKVNVQLEFNF